MNGHIREWKKLESKFLRGFRAILIIVAPVLLILLLRFIFTKVDAGKTMTSEMLAPFGLGRLAGLCGLIAFLTSAIIQLLKEQGEMRAKVHLASLKEWLTRRFKFAHAEIASETTAKEVNGVTLKEKAISVKWKDSGDSSADLAVKEIEALCAASSSDQYFYNLPTEQFCGQIGTAVDLVMIAPESHRNCFAALTSGVDTEHQAAVSAFVTSEPKEGVMLEKSVPPSENRVTGRKIIDADDYDRLKARLTNYAQRALDGLQLEAIRRWKRQLMFASIQISLGISLAVVAIVAPPPDLSVSAVWMFSYTTMICGVAGALLAPVAHDITSAIRGLRGR